MTVSSGLQGRPNPDSQANGAMMRVSPLGIFGANHDPELVAEWVRQDAVITHPHPVCQQVNALYTMAIARAVRDGCDARNLYRQIVTWAEGMKVDRDLLDVARGAAEAPPIDYVHQQGWVLTAFRNALWRLLHAPDLEWWTPSCVAETPTPTLPYVARFWVLCTAGTLSPANGSNPCSNAALRPDNRMCAALAQSASGP